jgi:hypothetical protein
MAGALAPFSYLWAERTLSAGPRTRARTLRLLLLVACKFTVVGGRGFTGPNLVTLIGKYLSKPPATAKAGKPN